MTNDELNEWWWNLSFKKVREIFSKNCDYADEVNEYDEVAIDDWWHDNEFERKLKIYELNK